MKIITPGVILPFHSWKEQFMKLDKNDGVQIIRDKFEYYALYGGYVSKMRVINEGVASS